MNAAQFGYLVGALIPTFIVSRLVLLCFRWWRGGAWKAVVVHLISWPICGALGALGAADGGAIDIVAGMDAYAIP